MAGAEDTGDEAQRGPPTIGPEASGAGGGGDPARIGFIGKNLGRFRISAELGRGGMATVYRAHDAQLGRDVAVKVMHGFFAGRADIEARFRREANAVAAIRHPSILALYDFAPPAGEEPGYIVSELIEGPGLRQLSESRGGRLLPEVAGLIAIRVAEALGAAHAAGIVHRDVKPDNVLIDRSGGGARVVLTDFGVAHVSGMDTMTATGAVLGSPAYMSPEQARGEDVGPTSDVFSVGVLLYQLCTGHLPYSGKDPLAVIMAILRGDYVRASKLEARIGPAMEQVISRCLLQDPGGRFSDGGAVAAALRETLASAELGDEEPALKRFLSDPEAFERDLSPRIARVAMAAAEHARGRGQLPRALCEVGRALAYVPDDPAARELLGRLGSRGGSRWIRTGIAAVGALIVIASGLFVTAPRWRRHAATTNETFASAPRVAPTAHATTTLRNAAVAFPDPQAGAPPQQVPDLQGVAPPPRSRSRAASETATNDSVPPRPHRGGRGTIQKRSGNSATSVTPPLASPAIAPISPPGVPGAESVALQDRSPGDPQTVVAATAVAPLVGSVILRASHGFCEPSLDAHPPSLRASYNNLAPGPHEIYCTLPQGGGKIHVATYDLRGGTRPSLIVVPGPDGRPVLGRPE